MVDQQRLLKNIKYTKRTYCGVCGAKQTRPIINLPRFPLTEIYTKRIPKTKIGFVNQAFHFCEKCQHGQLERVLDQQVLYSKSYRFRTSLSPTAKMASDEFLNFVKKVIKKKKLNRIIDIGCNDLYLLEQLKGRSKTLVGIDPVLKKVKQKRYGKKFELIGDYVENLDGKQIIKGVNHLVLSSHTLEHVVEPKALIQRLLNAAQKDTIFIFQFPCLELLVNDFRFDQIFHQHLNYFTLPSIQKVIELSGAELIAYDVNPMHWGTLMVAFRLRKKGAKKVVSTLPRMTRKTILKNYKLFEQHMDLIAQKITSLKNEKMYGYGAALMLPVLDWHLKGALKHLNHVIDDDPNKTNSYYINLPVQIKTKKHVKDYKEAMILLTAITAIRNVRALVPKITKLNPKQMIVPLVNY